MDYLLIQSVGLDMNDNASISRTYCVIADFL